MMLKLPKSVRIWLPASEIQDALAETTGAEAPLGYEWYEYLAECTAQPGETLEEQAINAAREFSREYPALGLKVWDCKIVKLEHPEFYTDGWMFEVEFN